MKISTANIKNPSYTENHEIFVGTHTGSLKRKSNVWSILRVWTKSRLNSVRTNSTKWKIRFETNHDAFEISV